MREDGERSAEEGTGGPEYSTIHCCCEQMGGGDATSEDAEPTSPSGGCSVVDAVQDRSPSSELEHVDAGSPSSELEHGEAAAKRSIPFARAVRTEG